MNSTSFLRYISILTPKLLSFPSQRRNGIPRLLKEQVTATHFLQFPAFFQVLMSVGITGSPGVFLSQSMIYSTVKLKKCNDISRASLVAQRLQCLPAMRETWVRSLGQEDPLEKEMATHSSILACRIPWTEEPGGLQSTGLQRVGHD